MPTERVQRQIERLLDEAEVAIAARDWALVAARADAVLALDQGHADALAYREAAERRLPEPGTGTPVAPPSLTAPAPAPLPTSFVSGRYVVLSQLGEGGRKVVYRARDGVLKREVAFALIKTEGLDDAGRVRVRREAELLAQLGTHPNVVTIFELGEDAGRPYLVSEFLPGGDVAQLILAAPDHRLPLPRMLALAVAVTKGLAYAHSHGVVHRDLKPGNVWLTDDGTPKLGDFGLAVAGSDARLTQAGMLVGTAAYLPPEQALGQEPTPQADLYALGCVLYELVTGRPPFLSDDPTAVITQHLTTPPVAPSWLSDRCPRDLETLILQLLAKRPEERPASALAVLEALGRIDPGQRPATHSQAGSNPLERLARGVFVGREQELARLRQAFDAAFAGQGSVVLLVGEPGVGKTRAAQELETYARLRGAQVLWGASHEASGAPAYWPWIQVGRQWGGNSDPARLVPALGSAITDLVRLFPDLARLPGVAAPAAVMDAEAAQFALFDAFVQFLRVASAETPLVVALDDLHWADKPSLQLLQHLARELGRLRLLLVGTYRDTELARTHPLAETLAALNRGDGFTRIVLRGLARGEVATYVRSTAGVEPSAALVEKLFEETEGNPFFLSEVVNLLTQEGTLTAERVSDIRVPDGVKEALGRRLDRISPETTALLQVAAIIGREFPYAMLTLLNQPGAEDDETLLRQIEEAVAARVIEELPQPGRYRFTHALMQETLLSELSTTRKVRLHGQVGEALERRWGTRAEERASRLAQHFGEAATLSVRHAAKAVRYGKLAAEQAEAATAWGEAARQYERVLALLSDADDKLGEDEAALLTALGGCHRHAFEERAAWRNLMRAIGLYRERGDGQGVARATLVALRIPAPPERHLALIEAALSGLGPDAPYLEAGLLVERATWGTGEAAEQAAARAGELARAHGYVDIAGRLTMRAALRAVDEGRYDEAIAGAVSTHAQLQAVGNGGAAPGALNIAPLALSAAGRLAHAEELGEQALSYARSVHYRRSEQTVMAILTAIALAHRDEVRLSQLLAAPDALAQLDSLLLRSQRLELVNDLAGAVAALPAPELAGNVPVFLLLIHGNRARVRFHAGDVDGAQRELTAWTGAFNACRRSAFAAFGVAVFFAAVDQALVALGDDETVQAAYALLQSQTPLRFSYRLPQGVDHLRGDLALRLGLVEEAEAHYHTGLAWAEQERVPVEQGRCLLGLAEIARRRGDRTSALAHLDDAATILGGCGALLFLRQAREAQTALLATHTEHGTHAGTERSVHVTTAPAPATDPGLPAPQPTEAEPPVPSATADYVFVSYTSTNRERALALAQTLEGQGISIWLDRRSIAGGASWDEEIVRGIRNCAVLAVLTSPEALRSPNVQQELRLALEFRKPLLPLLLSPTEYPDEVKYALAGRQWVELLDRQETEWLPDVLGAVRRLIARRN